ncbi:MAG: rsmB [Thermoleophilia bacterium]|nr:rsmB [Thermoleophilia bacterium]
MSPLPSKGGAPPRTERRLKRPTKVTPARWAAWLTVRRTFDDDAWTDRAFAAVAEQLGLDADPRERAFAQRLAYGTVQGAKRLDHVIGVLGKRPLAKLDPPVLHALRIGVHELLDLQQETGEGGERLGSASAHAAVSQAVELVRGVVGERAVAFTNAILRRAQVDGADILAKLDPADDGDLAVLLSMPEWLVTRVRTAHGQRGIDALAAQNEPHAGTAFRVNAAHAGEDEVPEGAEPSATVPGAIVVAGSTAAMSPAVDAGRLVPQSLSSQLVTLALDVQPGDRVLDMCAAPGGKTTHVASLLGGRGEVVAVELHEHRADSVRALASRTGTRELVRVRVGDATALDAADVGRFDRVLLDAPCTGTGVLAARPDARWKRTDAGVAELVELQRELLATAVRLLRPGGTLVYSTCSILREEDEDVVDPTPAGLEPAQLPQAVREATDCDGHVARTWPGGEFAEGFFIARFTKLAGEVA